MSNTVVEAALLFPRAKAGDDALFPLAAIDGVLEDLAHAIGLARAQLETGVALPGIDASDDYNDLAFALPANARAAYLVRKQALVKERLGEAAKIWDMA